MSGSERGLDREARRTRTDAEPEDGSKQLDSRILMALTAFVRSALVSGIGIARNTL